MMMMLVATASLVACSGSTEADESSTGSSSGFVSAVQTGAKGAKGDQGETGATGATGETGLTGPTGPMGDTGAQGAKGDKGDTGAAGANGSNGSNGTNGADGTNGTNGTNGAAGTNGTNGATSLMKVTNLPYGDANCAAGGFRVEAGVDADKNGTLDAGEVTQTQYVCNAIPRKRVMFTTSTRYNGNLGGVTGADEKCQARADATPALAGKTFKAWVSDATHAPRYTFTRDGQFVSTTGEQIAESWADLRDTVLSADVRDENGVYTPQQLWTGTDELGNSLDPVTCSNWTDGTNASEGYYGSTSTLQWYWSFYYDTGYDFCDTQRALYCVEQ